jgi:Ca-activated chloride channel homolog
MNTNDPNANDPNTSDANMNDHDDPNAHADPIGRGRENFGCDAFAEELALFVFGEATELTDERRAALERHLVSCAACRSERDALQRSLELLKSEALRDAAPQLSAERQAKLMEEARAQTHANAASGAEAPAIAAGRVVHLGRWAIAAGVIFAAGAGWLAWEELRPKATRDRDVALLAARVPGQTAAERGDPRDLATLAAGTLEKFREPAAGTSGAGTRPPTDTTPPVSSFDGMRQGLSTEGSIEKKLEAHLEREAKLAAPPADSRNEEEGASTGAGAFFKNGDKYDLKARAEGFVDSLDAVPNATGNPTSSPPAAPGTPAPVVAGAPRDGSEAKCAPPRELAQKIEANLARRSKGYAHADGGAPAPATDPSGGQPAKPAGSASPATPLDPDDEAKTLFVTAGGSTVPDSLLKTLLEGSPDIAGNTTTDFHTALQWSNQDSCTWMGADGNSTIDPATIGVLLKLGYLDGEPGGGGGDRAGPFPGGRVARLDPVTVGRLLAATCSPGDVVRFQSNLAAALGIDPAAPRADVEKDRDTIVREFLDRLSRRQNEPPRDMFFRYFGDHPFVATRIDCKSTFGMDVDTASYALARAYLSKGMLPPKAAVRTEEFVNAFKHELAPPGDETRRDGGGRDVFAIHTEIAPSPFGDEGQLLLQVGLKARVIPKSARKPVALTFIIDVSGSMSQDGRLELVKQGLHLLVNQLDERDTIGIVSFETSAHRILDPTAAANRGRIFAALDLLRPEGSTNVAEGLRLGYEMALEQLRSGAENRVILCSDGVANEGITDPKVLAARVAEYKSNYVYLNCVGVGMGNHNDALMDQLADEGDGFCAYLDRIEEARKIFVERLTGTLMTVARNAKIQVEFDPASVRRFRQLGYEKRALAHRDFRNDRVDAGEVGAGQEVVALYEIEPKGDAAGPLGTVRIRYEDPDKGELREQARQLFAAEVAPTLAKTTPRFRLSACVAEFAEILRQSVHARDGSFGAILRLAEPLVDELKGDADVPEFVALVQQAARLPDLLPPRNELVRCVDELKRARCLREEARDEKRDENDELMRKLEEQNRQLEKELRDALDRTLRHS